MALKVIGSGLGRTGAYSLKLALGRLLVYRPGDGWGPLCAFLGVPVPDTPYLRENTREQFQSRVREIRRD